MALADNGDRSTTYAAGDCSWRATATQSLLVNSCGLNQPRSRTLCGLDVFSTGGRSRVGRFRLQAEKPPKLFGQSRVDGCQDPDGGTVALARVVLSQSLTADEVAGCDSGVYPKGNDGVTQFLRVVESARELGCVHERCRLG